MTDPLFLPPTRPRSPAKQRTYAIYGTILPDLRGAAPGPADGLLGEVPDCPLATAAGAAAGRAGREGAAPASGSVGVAGRARRRPMTTRYGVVEALWLPMLLALLRGR